MNDASYAEDSLILDNYSAVVANSKLILDVCAAILNDRFNKNSKAYGKEWAKA